MNEIRPVLKKLLIASVALFVVAVSFMLSDIYARVCYIEHIMAHLENPHK